MAAILVSISVLPISVDLVVGFVYDFPVAVLALFVSKTLSSVACYLMVNKVMKEKYKKRIL